MIEARGLWIRRRVAGGPPREAVRNVSLRLQAGDLGLILGPSGAGKTTLLEALAGLLPPASGSVALSVGSQTWTWGPGDQMAEAARSHIGVLFQHPERQLFGATPLEDVGWGLGPGGTEKARRALERVELHPDLWGTPIRVLSRGERRRVAVAGILAREPSVLLLDEPHVGLDEAGQALISREIDVYRRERGAAVMVATHWPEVLLPHARTVVCLEAGDPTFSGPALSLRASVGKLPSVAAFLPFRWRLAAALRKPSCSAPWRDKALGWLGGPGTSAEEDESARLVKGS